MFPTIDIVGVGISDRGETRLEEVIGVGREGTHLRKTRSEEHEEHKERE